jgi:hypothetical protein
MLASEVLSTAIVFFGRRRPGTGALFLVHRPPRSNRPAVLEPMRDVGAVLGRLLLAVAEVCCLPR